MSEKEKCTADNRCSDCHKWLEERLAKCEDWEVNRKESYRKFELRFCYTNSNNENGRMNQIQHSETGGYIYKFDKCPHCQKSIRTIKSNDWGDKTIEKEDLAHSCPQQSSSSDPQTEQIKSYMATNQIFQITLTEDGQLVLEYQSGKSETIPATSPQLQQIKNHLQASPQKSLSLSKMVEREREREQKQLRQIQLSPLYLPRNRRISLSGRISLLFY